MMMLVLLTLFIVNYENIELRAQLEFLTSNYGKLEESHEDLLASHDRLKLAHDAIMSKVTSCEPHVVNSTSSQHAILSCASPSNTSTTSRKRASIHPL
jgi:hypothetical protein